MDFLPQVISVGQTLAFTWSNSILMSSSETADNFLELSLICSVRLAESFSSKCVTRRSLSIGTKHRTLFCLNHVWFSSTNFALLVVANVVLLTLWNAYVSLTFKMRCLHYGMRCI